MKGIVLFCIGCQQGLSEEMGIEWQRYEVSQWSEQLEHLKQAYPGREKRKCRGPGAGNEFKIAIEECSRRRKDQGGMWADPLGHF